MRQLTIMGCSDCGDHYRANVGAMQGACALVGIARGSTAEEMLGVYYEDYHDRGHMERTR